MTRVVFDPSYSSIVTQWQFSGRIGKAGAWAEVAVPEQALRLEPKELRRRRLEDPVADPGVLNCTAQSSAFAACCRVEEL